VRSRAPAAPAPHGTRILHICTVFGGACGPPPRARSERPALRGGGPPRRSAAGKRSTQGGRPPRRSRVSRCPRTTGSAPVAMAGVASSMEEGSLATAVSAGLQAMAAVLAERVTPLGAPPGEPLPDCAAARHGSETGSVVLGAVQCRRAGRRASPPSPPLRAGRGKTPDVRVGCGRGSIGRLLRSSAYRQRMPGRRRQHPPKGESEPPLRGASRRRRRPKVLPEAVPEGATSRGPRKGYRRPARERVGRARPRS
jgi:hypothetical protein